ncbi:YraN family protein [Endozoicomonas sp. Mp262]|uniref:YraN family protein n=1 Tax=Endozoicomonas sp. Mp262 TaxID=2919499 RepID=UPI0021D7E6BC
MPWQLKKLSHKGAQAEKSALHYLKKQGLRLVARNFACPLGELDLVMLDADVLTFIEVRFRSAHQMVDAKSSITPQKVNKIKKSAACFLQHHKKHAYRECRYDVVAISTDDGSRQNRLEWIQGAF